MIRMRLRWRLGLLMFVALVLLMLPAAALAVSSSPTLVLPKTQVWTMVIGALVPVVTYGLNYAGPWLTEPVKAGVLVVVSAAAAALYTALATNVIGFNMPTLQLVASGVFAAFAAHHMLWKPSGVSSLLGGGRNRAVAGAPRRRRRRKRAPAPPPAP